MQGGRNFNSVSDLNDSFIINEAAVKHFALKEPMGSSFSTAEINGKVVGVISDFHFTSMVNNVVPLVLCFKSIRPDDERRYPYRFAFVRVKPGRWAEANENINKIFHELSAGQTPEIIFQDQLFENLHTQQKKIKELISYFSVIALGLGLFGLFAVTAYTCRQRIREVAIRKVIGANYWQLILTLGSQTLKPVLPGCLLAIPFAYFGLEKWLDTMTVRIELNAWHMIVIILAVLLLSFLIVSAEALKTARKNPVKIIR